MGGRWDGDIDTAMDTVTWSQSHGVVVPPYRKLANTQTYINMNPALDLPRSAVSRGAASRTS